MGYTTNSYILAEQYRQRRLKLELDPRITIHVDPLSNDVEFWCDVGRIYRPLLIVYNNLVEVDEYHMKPDQKSTTPKFKQWINFTQTHKEQILQGKLTLMDLLQLQIVEYITAEEQENCYIAHSINELYENETNFTKPFTHCDIEQAIFGIAALLTPFGDHTQPTRVTYETNHGKQAGGWYAMNFPYRADKNRFFQFTIQTPLVYTLTHKWVLPNSRNVYAAMMSYLGGNQDDAIILNKGSVDRGLFSGAFYKSEYVVLESDEQIMTPNQLDTKGIKHRANYSKLVNGIIKVGSMLEYNDVMVGKVVKMTPKQIKQDGKSYSDKSIIYQRKEPAYVEDIIEKKDILGIPFKIIKLRLERPLQIGDKLCFDPETEILTNCGFIRVEDLKHNHQIACNNNGILSYELPTDMFEYDVINEPMCYFDSYSVNALVTRNHKMYVKNCNIN